MGRTFRTIALCTAFACVLAGAARGAPGLLVGVADDTLKWTESAEAQRALGYTRDLGIRAVRVTVAWRPGETRLGVDDRRPVDRMILATWGGGLRVVLAVYGRADDAPRTEAARNEYCSFAASLLRRYPGVNDVVIWNEPNTGRFWRPQFEQDGASAAPAAYEALLARCWDALHAVRPSANVIAASSPYGNDNPLSGSASHSPGNFYTKLGEAYRASGRLRPIFDTVGHNPYPAHNTEPPWIRHWSAKTLAQGDYERLMGALQGAFGGTRQPLPGQGRVSIWYMEQGFQTTIDPSKRAAYQGSETDRRLLPALVTRGAASTANGPAPDQATQLTDALNVAYCQPGVAAFFNFELADEPNLRGWQSGLLWTDRTPKPSYGPFKAAVRNLAAGRVDCERYTRLAVEASSALGFSTSADTAVPAPKRPKPPTIVVE